MKAIFRNQCGFSLVVVIIVLALLLWVTGAGLFFSSLNLKSTNNLKGGTSAMQAADAGIQHALALIPAGGDFNSFWAAQVQRIFLVRIHLAQLERAMERIINPRLRLRFLA